MRTAIVLIGVLGAMGIVQAGQITVVNWSGTIDVPDNGEYATSYVVNSAPSGAIVTGVSYQTLVDDRGTPANFWCSDYEIGLSSTARGGTADYLLVWDNAGGQTDGGADDDLANDSDIDLDDSASAFDGQAVNQRWYLVVKDNVSHVGFNKGLGSLKLVILTIQYIAPPSATTQAATGVTATGATLNGTVSNDGGEACQYRFRYKKEGGSYTYSAYTGSKTTGQSFSHALTGLDPGSTYYFAAQAKNSAGESTWPGSDTSFSTPALVPTVSTQPATSVTSTSATLNGRVTNDGGAACQYRFRSKESGTISYTESSWTGSVRTGESFNLPIPSGLSPGTTYVFAAKLKNSAGESAWGSELSFTTPPAKPVATTQAATGITATGATLNGTVSSNGGEACQYRFRHKKEGGSYSYTTYTGSKQTGQSFSEALTGLDPGTTYYFAAQAKNSAGESTWPGSDTSFTTPPVLPTATTLAATGVGSTSATANGTVANDGGAPCQYRFRIHEFGGAYTYSDWTGSVRTGQSFSFTLPSGLSPNTTYYFAAQLKNSAGEGAWGSELSFKTSVEKPVTGTLAASDIGPTSATLNGRIANDGGVACEYRFRYMKQGGSYTYTTYTGSKTTGQYFTHTLTGLDPEATYYFAAQAKNSAGESTWPGSDLSFTTVVVAPTVTTLAATGIGATSATANGSVADDGGAACQYRFRIHEFGGAYTTSDWTGSLHTGQSFSFALPSGLSSNTTYYFSAELKNKAGEGAWGSEMSFSTLVAKPTAATNPATDIAATSATLSGMILNDGGATCQYHFRYKKEGGSYTYTTYTGSKQTGQSFSEALTGLDHASTYYFAAQAKNSAGESTWPGSDTSFTTLPIPPTVMTVPATNITPTSATGNGRVTDDGGAPCQYRFRCRETEVIPLPDYTYSDWTGSVRTGQSFSFSLSIGLSPGTTYVFAAQLKNSAGEGEWGSNLTITLPVAKPVAGTLAATDVDGNSATLNGRIADDGSEACEYRFRYKKQGGDYVYTAYTGSEQTGHTFSHALTGLDRETTYYFAAQARNSAGESNWPPTDASFITHVLLPTATTLAATDITTVSATLNGAVAKDGGAVCQYRFRCKEVGIGAPPDYTYSDWMGSVTDRQTFSLPLPSVLSAGRKTYVFAAQLKNSAGEGPWGDDLTFTAMCVKPTAITKPATFVRPTGATLNGLVINDGGEACSCEFRYRLSPDTAYEYVSAIGLKKRTFDFFSYEVTGPRGATCYYSARATNSAGSSNWPAEDLSVKFEATKPTVRTESEEDQTPDTALAATTHLCGRLVDDGGTPCEYQFRYHKKDAVPVGGGKYIMDPYVFTPWQCCRQSLHIEPPDPNGSVPAGAACDMVELPFIFTYDVNGLDLNCAYEFTARARNSAGEGPWGDFVTFETPLLQPVVEMLPATNFGPDYATINCKVTNDGGAPCYVQWRIRQRCITSPAGTFPCDANWYEFPQYSWIETKYGGHPVGEPNEGLRTGQSWRHNLPDPNEHCKIKLEEGTRYEVQARAYNLLSDSNTPMWGEWSWESYFSTYHPPIINSPPWGERYFSSAKSAYFIEGITVPERVWGRVWWYAPPLAVDWYVEKPTGERTLIRSNNCKGGPLGPQEHYQDFDMGKDFHAGDKLFVIARGDDGSEKGYEGEPSAKANFTICPQPHLPSGLTLVRGNDIQSSPDELPDPNYWADTRGSKVTIFHDYLSDLNLKIDDDIPFFGGGDIGFTSSADIKVYVTRDYCRLWMYLPMSRIDVAKNQADDNIDGDFHVTLDLWYYFHVKGGWMTDSTVTLGADMKDHYDYIDLRWHGVGIWATFYMNLDLKVEVGAKYWEGGKHEWDGLFYTYVKPWLDAGINVGVAEITFDIGGGFKWLMMFPAEDVGDAFKQCCVKMWVEVTVSVLCWDGSWDMEWKRCPIGKWNTDDSYDVASVSDADLDMDGASFQLMGRDYIESDYAVWQPPGPGDRRNSSNLSVQSVTTGAQGASGEEQVLQTNVFKLSQPALAADEGELFLAWIYDEPNRSSVNRTQVAFSRSDKETWTPPVPIWDDGTADFAPQLATLPNGQVLCTWQNTNRVLPDDAELEDMAAALDIAVASCDSATGLWTAKAITSDLHLDHTPLIATAANNTAMLMWVSNDKDDILSVDPNATNTIRYCLWNGSSWSEPGIAAAGIKSLLKTALAYSGTHAVYIYSADIDGNQGTEQDMELFTLIYDGAQWSPPIRLTDDSVADANPQVVYDEGEPLLVWYRDKSIVSCRSLDTTSIQQIVQPSSAGAMDFRLAKSPTGRISLVWAGTSTTVNALDVFTTTYDPVFGVWSDAYALTSDQDRERALAPAYVSSDELAIAYNKARVADDEEGDQRVYQTDLCVLRHAIGSDLAVTTEDISMDKANPKPGDSVTITAVIHNLGDVAEADVPVAFYNGNPADGGELIGTIQTIKGPIPAASTDKASVSWTIPDTKDAQTVYVVVDPQSSREERSLTNNVASIAVTTPDLTVRSFYAGETEPNIRRITAWIANDGVASARNIGVSVRKDSAQGQELKSFTIPVIDAGSSEKVSWDWDIAGTKFSTPEITLYVVVDPNQRVTESNEKNNTSQCVVNVSKKANIPGKGTVGNGGLTSTRERWLSHSGALAGQPHGDTNHDGRIDVKDLSVLAKDWLREAPWHTD